MSVACQAPLAAFVIVVASLDNVSTDQRGNVHHEHQQSDDTPPKGFCESCDSNCHSACCYKHRKDDGTYACCCGAQD